MDAIPSYSTPDYYRYECGCIDPQCHGPSRGTGKIQPTGGLCLGCREARIGQEIEFLRFGATPESGRSRNHRDRTKEDGVSVYEITGGRALLVGWHFDFHSRPAFSGRGIITGWGSDGEPLVKVIEIRRISKSNLEKLT